MQNEHTTGNPRLRKCIEEIIRTKNIRKFEDFDFQTLVNFKLGAAEISSIINSVWIKEANPYTKQISKWMQEQETFDPAPATGSAWVDPKDLLYRDLKHDYYKESGLFLRSPIELWHVVWKPAPRGTAPLTHLYAISTSVAPSPQRYFMRMGGRNGSHFEEVEVGDSMELKKRRTVMGGMGTGLIMHIMERPRVKYDGPDMPLLRKLETIV